MHRSRKKSKTKSLLSALFIVSLIGVLLPERITGRLISLVQVIVPLQDWLSRSGDLAADALVGHRTRVPWETADKLQRDNAALRHQLVSLASRFDELQRQQRQLAGIRQRGLVGGRLIPARTVAADALPWRRSRLIKAVALSGVKFAAPVASNHFSIHTDENAGLHEGLAVLCGEALVGFIEQVGTHAARVRLLTDKRNTMSVLVGRLEDGRYFPLESEFWLTGTGGPLLEIRDVDHRYVKSDAVRVGDVVLSSAGDPRLAVSLMVGTITRIRSDPDSSLLYVLEVKPPLTSDQIRAVFVVDPDDSSPPESLSGM